MDTATTIVTTDTAEAMGKIADTAITTIEAATDNSTESTGSNLPMIIGGIALAGGLAFGVYKLFFGKKQNGGDTPVPGTVNDNPAGGAPAAAATAS